MLLGNLQAATEDAYMSSDLLMPYVQACDLLK